MADYKLKPRVLILGISGFLGYSLALHLKKKFSVVGIYFSNPVDIPDVQCFPVNLANLELVEHIMRIQQPQYTIMAAGVNDRDFCREHTKLAENFNIVMPVNFAIAANKIKAKNIHISCADIYESNDGDYKEEDIDFSLDDDYGKHKQASESYVKSQTMECTILRIGRVMGLGHPHRHSHFDKIRLALSNGQNLLASKNIVHSYLSARTFANAMERIISEPIPMKHRTFHIGGCTMSESEFAKTVCQVFKYDEKLVKPPGSEPRPLKYSLNSTHFMETYKGWQPDDKKALFNYLYESMRPGLPFIPPKTLQAP
jgi:dTDP-4-dehydrorhamnose reductase